MIPHRTQNPKDGAAMHFLQKDAITVITKKELKLRFRDGDLSSRATEIMKNKLLT